MKLNFDNSNSNLQKVGTCRLKREGFWKMPTKMDVYYKPAQSATDTNCLLKFKRKGGDIFQMCFQLTDTNDIKRSRVTTPGRFGLYADLEEKLKIKVTDYFYGSKITPESLAKENFGKLSEKSKTFIKLSESISDKTVEEKAVKIIRQIFKIK